MYVDNGKGPILVIAPHPDDETLGAGGSLLRAIKHGREVHWLIITRMRAEDGWPAEKMKLREGEIATVAKAYGFASTQVLPFPAAKLDTIPLGDLVSGIGNVVSQIQPEILLIPHRGDAHSDHAAVHDASAACGKWFRYPFVRSVLVYETLSETDAAIQDAERFVPNVFIDISNEIDQKLEITMLFGDEIKEFPFPRSLKAIRALAELRGVAAGVDAAESFMLLRTRA